jgi:hypothetical protein
MISPSLTEQIQLFKSVFKGRDDVFAIRWEKGNKNGYMPAHSFDPKGFVIWKDLLEERLT